MIRPSERTAQFHYAIRNIVGAAEERERAGRPVIYLNIGDPQAYGFRPPAHVTEAVTRALAISSRATRTRRACPRRASRSRPTRRGSARRPRPATC